MLTYYSSEFGVMYNHGSWFMVPRSWLKVQDSGYSKNSELSCFGVHCPFWISGRCNAMCYYAMALHWSGRNAFPVAGPIDLRLLGPMVQSSELRVMYRPWLSFRVHDSGCSRDPEPLPLKPPSAYRTPYTLHPTRRPLLTLNSHVLSPELNRT